MSETSQGFAYSAEQKHQQGLSQSYINLQGLIFSHDLRQSIRQMLDENPALELENDDLTSEDDTSEIKLGYNDDFDQDADEYETGKTNFAENEAVSYKNISESLEQIALDEWGKEPEKLGKAFKDIKSFKETGYLPEEADSLLRDELIWLEKSVVNPSKPFLSPAFEVSIEDGKVISSVVSYSEHLLRTNKGYGKYSQKAKEFVENLRKRRVFLNNFGCVLFEELQRDFFHMQDRDKASSSLIPIPIKKLISLIPDAPMKIDKQFVSKLGHLTVSCSFGCIPVSFFTQEKSDIVPLWVTNAFRANIKKAKDQRAWIIKQMEERISKFEPDDRRLEFIEPLLKIFENDIRNAFKKIGKNKNAS